MNIHNRKNKKNIAIKTRQKRKHRAFIAIQESITTSKEKLLSYLIKERLACFEKIHWYVNKTQRLPDESIRK